MPWPALPEALDHVIRWADGLVEVTKDWSATRDCSILLQTEGDN
jgi:hypothetical protein